MEQLIQMAAPIATICIGPCMCGQKHVCAVHYTYAPHQIYKRGMQHIPGLTFWMTLGQGTLCTFTLFVETPGVSCLN